MPNDRRKDRGAERGADRPPATDRTDGDSAPDVPPVEPEPMEEQMAELVGLVQAAKRPIPPARDQEGLLVPEWEAIVRAWAEGLVAELSVEGDAELNQQLADAQAANRVLVRRVAALEGQLKKANQGNQGAEEIATAVGALEDVSVYAAEALTLVKEQLEGSAGGDRR